MAGIAAGSRYGVAKKAKLIAVRVLDSEARGGTNSSMTFFEYFDKCH